MVVEHACLKRMKQILAGVKRRPVSVALVLLSSIHLFLSLANTGSDWMYGHHGYCGANRSIAARNYLRYGLVGTQLGTVLNLGEAKDGLLARPKVYWHHPPGPSLVLALVYSVTGAQAWAGKLLVSLLSMANFFLLFLIFRRHWGDAGTLAGLLFLTFMPLYASYLNFVNFEPFAATAMLLLLFIYESHVAERRWWKVLLMGLAVLCGVMTDFSVYPFFFFFWGVVAWTELAHGGRDRKSWGLVLLIPSLVAAGLVLFFLWVTAALGLTLSGAVGMVRDLFSGANHLTQPTPHLVVLEKWGWYLHMLGPMAMVLSALWLGSFGIRAAKRSISRGDAYVLVLFLTAFVYWFLLPERSWVHEYYVFYFSIPMAMASGAALWEMSELLARGRPLLRLVLRVAVPSVFVVMSVPIIWSSRVFPTYQFMTPPHALETPRQYDYLVTLDALADFVRDRTAPSEKVVVIEQAEDLRMDFGWHLDREFKVFPNGRLAQPDLRKGAYAFLIVDPEHVAPSYLDNLLRHYLFVSAGRYYAFDLGRHITSIRRLRMQYEKRGFFGTYFRSLSHPAFRMKSDPWISADLTLALRRKPDAERLWKESKLRNPRDLSSLVADYNLKLARREKPDLARIRTRMNRLEGGMLGKYIEYLGSRVGRNAGGREFIEMVFRGSKSPGQSFNVRLSAEPMHEDADLREAIGAKTRVLRFVVPSTMWKPGALYVAEGELDLFTGPYDLSFDLISEKMRLRPKNGSDRFPIGKGDYGIRFPAEWVYLYETIR